MKSCFGSALLLALTIAAVSPLAGADDAPIKKGDKLQTLSNLHPDMGKRVLYTMNYQLPGLIPVCSEVTVKKIGRSSMTFTYEGMDFQFEYDGHTEKAGVPFAKVLNAFFGPACDKAKIDSLSTLDREGISTGKPVLGMSRDGVLFAMGRPPFHANPSLETREWMYWKNRFGRTAVEFDGEGKVSNIR